MSASKTSSSEHPFSPPSGQDRQQPADVVFFYLGIYPGEATSELTVSSFAGKLISYGPFKNAPMQGAPNPERGVATNKGRLPATPASW